MSDIFAEDDDDESGSLFGSSLPSLPLTKPSQKSEPKAQPKRNIIPQLSSSPQSKQSNQSSQSNSTLASIPANAMILNPSTNQYQQVGPIVLLIQKTDKDQILILPIAPNKKTLTVFPCTANSKWEIQNEVYGTSFDAQNKRWLFLFKSPQVVQTFITYALSQQALQQPVSLRSSSEELPENLLVNSITVDFDKKEPLIESKEININDSNYPYLSNIKSLKLNSQTIISLSPTVFIFFDIKPSSNSNSSANNNNSTSASTTPSTTTTTTTTTTNTTMTSTTDNNNLETKLDDNLSKEVDNTSKQIAQTSKTQEDIDKINKIISELPDKPQEEIKQDKNDINDSNTNKSKEEQKLPIKALEEEINQKFDQIELMLLGMQNPIRPGNGVVIPHKRLLSQIEETVNQSIAKDTQLSRLDVMIKKLGKNQIEREENKIIEEQIKSINDELELYKVEKGAKSETKAFKTKIKRLKEQLTQLQSTQEEAEKQLSLELSQQADEKLKQIQLIKEENEKNMKEIEEQQNILETQLKLLSEENQKIKEEKENENIDLINQIKSIDQQSAQIIKTTLQKMSIGIMEMISGALNPNKQYTGEIVLNAMKKVLEKQADDILNPDDDYEEEEEEENEEEENEEEEE